MGGTVAVCDCSSVGRGCTRAPKAFSGSESVVGGVDTGDALREVVFELVSHGSGLNTTLTIGRFAVRIAVPRRRCHWVRYHLALTDTRLPWLCPSPLPRTGFFLAHRSAVPPPINALIAKGATTADSRGA